MHHSGKPLLLTRFDSGESPLSSVPDSQQLRYIVSYLTAAGAVSVLIEQNYFDRDYLDEFSAFYSKSAKGYSNICKRLHFFSVKVTEKTLHAAIGGSKAKIKLLQKNYLGFLVLRPLDIAAFGRTVLAWYKNTEPSSLRVNTGVREYTCNILGLKLVVSGIPWQQQDRGVSACATIALWSMFHSSAFDANHSIPTTVEITQNALGASSGRRAFPSHGLTIAELKEAIHAQNLTPKLIDSEKGFPPKYLASMCAANIRSGYPVLLVGDYIHESYNEQHAICCVGFREKAQDSRDPGTFSTMDDETEIFYVHDDNVGPNVRCKLIIEDGVGVLETAPPDYVAEHQIQPIPPQKFRPTIMIIAVHEEIRMNADMLAENAANLAGALSKGLNKVYELNSLPLPAISYNSQFYDIRNFFSNYLHQVLEGDAKLLAKVRLALGSDAPPLSLHIGLVKIAIVNGGIKRLIDVIYDTTDSGASCPVMAHIVYDPELKEKLLDHYPSEIISHHFGTQILAYHVP